MTQPFDPHHKTDLSSFLDQEVGAAEETRQLLNANFGAQLHYRNIENISRACQQQGAPIGTHPGFLERLMGALDDVAQIDETEDFECLSAWTDGEHPIHDESGLTAMPAQHMLHNLQALKQALNALPLATPSADFTERVMAALPDDASTRENQRRLSAALQALPNFDASADFAQRVMTQLESTFMASDHAAQNTQSLSNALQALPQVSAPAGFAEQVMQRLEQVTSESNAHSLSAALQALSTVQAPAGFTEQVMQRITALAQPILSEQLESISANLDGELSASESRHIQQELQAKPALAQANQQHQQLSTALKALPQPQVPADFVARVMLATEQAAKPKLFALPWLVRSRAGQMVAGFGLFGLLVMFSQTLINGTQGTSGIATGSYHIIQVEHQPEDLLFTDLIDMDNVLENVAQEDYNLWIGG